MSRRIAVLLVALTLCLFGLWYLRDPSWLVTATSGLRGWETDRDGARYRWTGGHASFFVPSDWPEVEIPLRTTFSPTDRPIVATITIDDQAAGRVVLSDGAWRRLSIRMPPPHDRKVRRIDIRVDRTREGNRGVQIGEVGPGRTRRSRRYSIAARRTDIRFCPT